MKTSIFIRILLATLLPMVFVFIMVISTISNIIYASGTKAAQQFASWEAKQIVRQFTDTLDQMTGLLRVVSQSMATLDYKLPQAEKDARFLAKQLLEADASFYCTWFVVEPEVFAGRYLYQTFLRDNGQIREIFDLSPELLADPQRSPWYHGAISSGQIYLDLSDYYDYGLGKNIHAKVTMTAPILREQKAVGAVGIDVDYENMFDTGDLLSANWQVMLLSVDGQMLYSSGPVSEESNFFELPFSNAKELKQAIEERQDYMGEAWSPLAGADSLICLYPVTYSFNNNEPIFLYLEAPISDIYSVASSSMDLILSTSILGLLLLSFSVFLATRNIVRPIKRLTVDFNRASHGDVELTSPQDDARQSNVVELDILESALWKMLGQIHQNHELRLKATEEQVEKEKVLAASQAKSQFFASMSHEIRTPMNAILGISEILLHHDLSEQERKYVKDIKVSSESLLTIINDILDISRLDSGKLELVEKNFDFNVFLENIQTMAKYLAEPNQLEFIYTTSHKLPSCLYGDDVRMRQILLNLLSNACKFTSKGSVKLSVLIEDNKLVFAVADTGVGISKEELTNLFEPFKRIDNARNQKIQGTGLGLSITKNLVEMMKGNITVESMPGKGTTFVVALPLVAGDVCALEDTQPAESAVYKPGIRILIVDDNKINLTVAQGLLDSLYNFDCDLALSGEEALALLAKNNYDLIFMDHMMPGMDGLETTRHIRAMGGKFTKIPIIALTANAVEGAKEIMIEAGMDDYLTKPIEAESLDLVLRKWLASSLEKS